MAASCVLRAVLSRTLSRSRCSGGVRWPLTSARVVPEAGRRAACWEAQSRRQDGTKYHRRRGGGLWAAVGMFSHSPVRNLGMRQIAFSLFSSTDEDQRDEAQRKEDDIILLLKKAKLSMHRGNLQAASSFFHQAVALAQQTHNKQAIIYTYSQWRPPQMANLAYIQGHLDSAEKLFKAAMSYMLAGGTPEDDNAVIEMSLKLATIYAEQNKAELAEHGFSFCVESLEGKLEKQTEDVKTAGSSKERHSPSAGFVFGLASAVPGLKDGLGHGWTGLQESPGHLPPGTGTGSPTDSGPDERLGHHLGPAGSS
ncbi:PREDICTED: tetratricopeptide repeat protein 19, mitochondrial isoform X6 [Poecilia mexicana]|uniref:tetratricopeptide repeat protein 19, mitochondrial isoform X6 n=1 Tax=Poecilia mexicana TaxID=48701 RepID=UPI00072EC261|nr:PREDICTED: tetratricopeptide repeat protein 19, mitochondrial isoform X6 [Poecilia mexicana]